MAEGGLFGNLPIGSVGFFQGEEKDKEKDKKKKKKSRDNSNKPDAAAASTTEPGAEKED